MMDIADALHPFAPCPPVTSRAPIPFYVSRARLPACVPLTGVAGVYQASRDYRHIFVVWLN